MASKKYAKFNTKRSFCPMGTMTQEICQLKAGKKQITG